MIEDLSFSGLVNIIQRDKEKGKQVMIELSERFIDAKKEVGKLELMLQKAKCDQETLSNAVANVLKHLELQTPLAIKLDKSIIVITDISITIETNVL